MANFDVDVDLPRTVDIAKLFPGSIRASRVDDGELVPHPCGSYFENIPVDPLTKLAAIPHKEAAEVGYTKIDFLHLTILEKFRSKAEFLAAARKTPNWDLLKDPDIVSQLFQINKHWVLLQQVRPKSVIELSDVIALIRPDKRGLLNTYLKDRVKNRHLLYRAAYDDKSAFRKGHSLSYSFTIIAQLNTIGSV